MGNRILTVALSVCIIFTELPATPYKSLKEPEAKQGEQQEELKAKQGEQQKELKAKQGEAQEEAKTKQGEAQEELKAKQGETQEEAEIKQEKREEALTKLKMKQGKTEERKESEAKTADKTSESKQKADEKRPKAMQKEVAEEQNEEEGDGQIAPQEAYEANMVLVAAGPSGYATNPNATRTGYHLSPATECDHKVDDALTMYVDMTGLTNTKEQLESKLKIVKNDNRNFIKGKDYTVETDTVTVPGEEADQVSGNTLTVSGPNIPNGRQLIAGPYLCPDGSAAYTYIKLHFSYCNKAEQWIYLGASHHWLGCVREEGVTEDHTFDGTHMLYQWQANAYIVKYNKNSGTGTTADSTHTYDKAKALTANGFARKGYRFNGWNTKANGTGSDYPDKDKVKNLVKANGATVTLYAQWTKNNYTVKYDMNSTIGTIATGITVNSTHTYDVAKALTANGFARKGYQFIGWNTNPIGTGMSYKNKESVKNLTETNKGTVVLYAQWEVNSYKVRYNANEGNGTMKNSDHRYDKIQPLDANKFSRQFYLFKGWATQANGSGTSYEDMQSVKNLTDNKGLADKNGAVIDLYAQWEKHLFNVAYNGNGQSSGTNMLEKNIWLGTSEYVFQDNVFGKVKEEEKKKPETGETYRTSVFYNFVGWNTDIAKSPQIGFNRKPHEKTPAEKLHMEAKENNVLTTGKPIEDAEYREVSGLDSNVAIEALKSSSRTEEYANVFAIWNASPTIVPDSPPTPLTPPGPGENPDRPVEMDGVMPVFYEGQDVTKSALISHLLVDDSEDGDLKDKVRIVKIKYTDGKIKTGYEKEWGEDVPNGFLLDTYFMEMEKDEIVEHLVTYAVTDKDGFETTVELPVKVKYNYPPAIKSYTKYYYFKTEANAGNITEDAVLALAEERDKEDGDKIKGELKTIDFDPQPLMMQKIPEAEFPIYFKVTDAYKKTTKRTLTVVVVDADAIRFELPKKYTRYISHEFMDTLDEHSLWREPENWSYLEKVLRNEDDVEQTWYFTHEDVVKAKAWKFADGENWRIGQEANKEFYELFQYCIQE
ncbi:InlB B-repeat-containing protein [Lachnospiraceae bacterium ZAX-1]